MDRVYLVGCFDCTRLQIDALLRGCLGFVRLLVHCRIYKPWMRNTERVLQRPVQKFDLIIMSDIGSLPKPAALPTCISSLK